MYSWVRDLCSEGIEPNPGPRYITKNVNGIADLKTWEIILFNIASEHKKSPIGAIFLQEIRIGDATKHKRMAEEHGLYMLAHGNRSNSKTGGTAIVIPQDMIEKNGTRLQRSIARPIIRHGRECEEPSDACRKGGA